MHPDLVTILLPLILTSLISTQFPGHLCQMDPYHTCRQRFQCGNIRHAITYPFWGGNRPAWCGHPGFELDCQADVPLINISSVTYQVLDINFVKRTLQVARQDLLNNTCPTFLHNTTLDQLFDFSSTSNDRNITLYYSCNISLAQISNCFNCSVNGTESSGFYLTGEPSDLGINLNCENIFVPVNAYAAQKLLNPGVPLQHALASGFSIHWSVNHHVCKVCTSTGGVCGYNVETAMFACICPDASHAFTCKVLSPGSRLSVILVSTVFGSTILIILAIILFCYFARKCISNESNQNVEKFILNHGSLALKRYTYTEIRKVTRAFSEKLGQGGFGSVYKGVLPDGRIVAIKVLKETNSIGEEFINEVASISRTSHVNIVNLLGFCYDKNKRALVYEFMANKSLDKFIYQDGSLDKDFKLGWNKLYEIAKGTARGLEYLHRGCNARIVHFDIKPQNILLDEEFCPKISDFGLAKLCRKKQSILTSVFGTRGTIGYIAPEVFCRNFGAVSHKSDVYSYGMMVLEMVGARNIEEARTVLSSENYFPDKIYEQGIVREMEYSYEIMSEEEVETVRKMFLIGFWCIQTAPCDRPPMSKVVEMFEGSIESIQIPPKPFLSSPKLSMPEYSSSCVVGLGTESSE